MTLLLAGDIGGTKTILQLVEATDTGLNPLYKNKYPSQKFPDLTPIVQTFLQEAAKELGQPPEPSKACFAIAGPVEKDHCILTNLSWELEGRRLEKDLNISHITLINDFSAIGYGIFGLTENDQHILQDVPPDPNGPIAILGAGTGLGQGYVVPQSGDYRVFSSEGGHVDFAPRNLQEYQLLEYMKITYNLERISVERIVSGQGIVAIYNFLKTQGEIPESPEIAKKLADPNEDFGVVITQAGLAKGDDLSEATMNLFVSLYGAEAGNIALKFLPSGGLYVAGGIAANIVNLLQEGDFLPSYYNKGRMTPLLHNIPIRVITNPQVGLIGAGICASRL
ncbi:glucokinase [Spirulina sp. CS-785/01]|uniref:glucokinase n=1 Tax=Spirulina sp. CS-785/01 TaxID=3021716 RepID=UPI00232AFDBC|nr:glucokinase [Spirulina sp. CS-785/01]MDB9312707.1 glucokinase [Spirulina sp. CS-785/01]